MVKANHQKTQKKQQTNANAKKQGKLPDRSQFLNHLDALGLRILEVTADGNCLFRAIADQLEGNEEEHQKYRNMVVQHISGNREMFEPFIEDDVPFDEYCLTMGKDGTWAGHMELQAASLVTHCNICIHQSMSPRWYIRNFDDHRACMIHLSYHDREHYNSIRLKDDPSDGPARPIVIKADADLSATSHQQKHTTSKSTAKAHREVIQTGYIKVVIAGSGCEDYEKVEQVLLQVNGDVDAAIEFLIADKGSEDISERSDPFSCTTDTSYDERRNSEETSTEKNKHTTSDASFVKSQDKTNPQKNDKNIPRNKVCPCGSKKKYKSCCGSATRKSYTKFVVNELADSKKNVKERKKGVKGDSAKTDDKPPNIGALCI